MAADDLAPCVARVSAALVLSMKDTQVLVFHEEEIQLPVPFHCQEVIENANIL